MQWPHKQTGRSVDQQCMERQTGLLTQTKVFEKPRRLGSQKGAFSKRCIAYEQIFLVKDTALRM